MTRRTIMIFPKFKDMDVIDEIRTKYDPLANNVEPHITTVFTFESDFTTEQVKNHLEKVLSEIKPFRLKMDKIVKLDNPLGKYLFFLIKEGVEEIKEISSKLYGGIIEEYKPGWLNEKTYLPHMTLGKFESREELDSAYEDVKEVEEEFSVMVDKVSVEIIDENEDSIIEIEFELS